ncbi:anti-sigma factor family protein [Edaphobacter flagellatus]|uniref:anti-sigma factor family protein n=1 Tax=Edaphobacter flagellatus TaxID=1933044 RepID=UPI0021B1B047|nr:zf-HC2 domain-containing protein [Edaphobacter flagellatus]
MNGHLSAVTLNALIDGQLAAEELRVAKEHLDRCPSCTSDALEYALLKNTVARNGQRHTMPAGFEAKIRSQISAHQAAAASSDKSAGPRTGTQRNMALAGWAAAAALLLSVGGAVVVEQRARLADATAMQTASLAAEVVDQHVATLANSQPQVVSSDRHTVKPWFQGKIPFSFNLPEPLPQDTKLDGANLAYLYGHPAAQLLYSIGRHRVSVFLTERTNSTQTMKTQERAGYHLVSFSTADLDAVAISDVDPARLAELVRSIEQAQNGSH